MYLNSIYFYKWCVYMISVYMSICMIDTYMYVYISYVPICWQYHIYIIYIYKYTNALIQKLNMISDGCSNRSNSKSLVMKRLIAGLLLFSRESIWQPSQRVAQKGLLLYTDVLCIYIYIHQGVSPWSMANTHRDDTLKPNPPPVKVLHSE